MKFETLKFIDDTDFANPAALTSLVYEVLHYEMTDDPTPGPMILYPENILEMTESILKDTFEEQFPNTAVPNQLSDIIDQINLNATVAKTDLIGLIVQLRNLQKEDAVIRF